MSNSGYEVSSAEIVAREANDQFRATLTRWMTTRACVALALTAAGAVLWLPMVSRNTSLPLFSFPLWGGALIFLLMFLDAHQRWREVKGRRWKSLAPRLGEPPLGAATAGVAQPPPKGPSHGPVPG